MPDKDYARASIYSDNRNSCCKNFQNTHRKQVTPFYSVLATADPADRRSESNENIPGPYCLSPSPEIRQLYFVSVH